MDVESQQTLTAAIHAAQIALQTVLDDAFIKVETIIRDGIAELVGGLEGWQLSISPITIKLSRSIK